MKVDRRLSNDRRWRKVSWTGFLIACSFLLAASLVGCGSSSNRPSASRLMSAVGAGEEEVVRKLVPAQFSVNVRGRLRRTPLHGAAEQGRLSILLYLLEQGARVDASDSGGATPLMLAAAGGHERVMSQLLDHKADPRERDDNGSTVLMYAASGGDVETLQLLIEAGAQVEARTSTGRTPMMDAALRGHRDAVELLLEHGAAINVQDRYGGTPLSRAIFGGHAQLARFLLKRGADPSRFPDSPTLVHAARQGFVPLVTRLLKLGADPNATWNGVPALVEAAARMNVTVARRLLEGGANPNVRTRPPIQPGVTPLMVAAMRKRNSRMIRLLIRHGARVNDRVPAARDMTPVMFAILHDQHKNVRELLDHGADPHLEREDGLSGFELARLRGSFRSMRILNRFIDRSRKGSEPR